MSDTPLMGLPEAARHLGVPVRVLRRAMRAGTIPAPAGLNALTGFSAEWLASAQAAVKSSPKALSRAVAGNVPAFARYEGTSAWHQFKRRVRAYAWFRAAAAKAV